MLFNRPLARMQHIPLDFRLFVVLNTPMSRRIIFGAVMIAVLAGVIWADWWWERTYDAAHPGSTGHTKALPLAAVFLPLLLLGFVEYARMARSAGVRVLWPAGLLGVAMIACSPLLTNLGWHSPTLLLYITFLFGWPLVIIGLVVILVFLNQMITGRLDDALRRIAATLLGILYLGVGGGLLLKLRINFGIGFLVMFLAAVKFTDIGAYFTGSFCGKHKLIPWLSLGKSWEGLLGGMIAAGIVGLVAWILRPWLLNGWAEPWWKSVVFCVGLGLAGQFGDLCESLLKRSAGVKDSGALVPQFGGVLDILDSPLMAAPVAYVLIALFAAIT